MLKHNYNFVQKQYQITIGKQDVRKNV